MSEIPILFYLFICIINFIIDKARIVWFLVFIYFLLIIKIQDPLSYFVLEYTTQSFLFIIIGLLFYESDLKIAICFILSILSIINLLCYMYPLEYPLITNIFITITDRIYFETLLVISCTFTDLKTKITSFINIGLISVSYIPQYN
ncbi:hypothetical protein KLEP7_gp27 [Pseudaeromonas phage vB_PpeM_ KLEP7]|nr:hypothetical protein KLEP7_gp27 [Pseudaeromonas phage vB_PpeM_ KLEP7]